MKRVFLIFLFLLLPGYGYAGPFGSSVVYAGVHHNYIRLKFNNPSDLRGFLTGLTAGVEHEYCSYFGDLNFEGYWTTGRITGDPCQRSRVQEYFVKLKTGMSFCVYENFILKPYIGFGWDNFHNRQDPDASCGLVYRYNKLFIPVGFLGYWKCGDLFSLGLQGEWRPDVYSRVCVASRSFKLYLSNAFRAAAPLTFTFGSDQSYALSIVPFFDWNRFGRVREESSLGTPIPIPRLIRWDLGFRVLVGAKF